MSSRRASIILHRRNNRVFENYDMKTFFTFADIRLIDHYLYAIFYLLVLLDSYGGLGRRR